MHQKLKFIAVPLLILTMQSVPMLQLSAYAEKPIPASSARGRVAASSKKRFELESGTSVRLRFNEAISSKTAQRDQPVFFQVAEDVFVNGKLVIAEGAKAKGYVREVQKSGMMGKKGKLDIALRQVELVSGEKVKLLASPVEGG
jgi:translation elongation factor EF-Tu-like GTPase